MRIPPIGVGRGRRSKSNGWNSLVDAPDDAERGRHEFGLCRCESGKRGLAPELPNYTVHEEVSDLCSALAVERDGDAATLLLEQLRLRNPLLVLSGAFPHEEPHNAVAHLVEHDLDMQVCRARVVFRGGWRLCGHDGVQLYTRRTIANDLHPGLFDNLSTRQNQIAFRFESDFLGFDKS